nr:hypothetical protein [uncultured Mediterranean phage uvMED]
MTIYEIKEQTKKTAPHFFSRETMKFFNQRLKDFKVKKLNETEYLIYANSYWNGQLMGKTTRIFDTTTNDLKNVSFVDADLLT